jgi:hypothetical protein
MDYAPLRASVIDTFGEDMEAEVGGVRQPLRAVFLEPMTDAVGDQAMRPNPQLRLPRAAWAATGAGHGDVVVRGASEIEAGTRYTVVDVPPVADPAGLFDITLRQNP